MSSCARIIVASPYSIPPQLPLTCESSLSNAPPRNDSFASYLAVVRDNLTPSDSDHFPIITPTRLRTTPLHINLPRKRSGEDTEIEIFAAEKYFNGCSPNSDPTTPVEKTTKSSPYRPLSKSNSLTWTVAGRSCGGSSQITANSSNVLLHDPRRRTLAGCSRGGGGRGFLLGGFGFCCSSCSRRHAVSVNNNNNNNKARESATSIIITSGSNVVRQRQSICRSPESWRRMIETSSPAANMPSSLQRRRKALLPRAPPPPQNLENEEEDDDRSESSSDLFEIESVAMSRAGYEPSEASIAWSVVTDSAANVSVASDRSVEIESCGRKKSAGLLLLTGCASHKAVEVTSMPAVGRCHVHLESGGGSGQRDIAERWVGPDGAVIYCPVVNTVNFGA